MKSLYKLSILLIALFLNALVLGTYVQAAEKIEPVKKDLPLEISEKYYKKEAILKFNEAVKNWELKNTDDAINLWNESLKIDPTLWTNYLGLAQAYDQKKEYSKALEAFKAYLKLAPKAAEDRKGAEDAISYLSHLLEHGEKELIGADYLSLVKTKHEGNELYTRWDLKNPLKIYFFPSEGVINYKQEFQDAFLSGAIIWQQALPDLKFEVLNNDSFEKLKPEERKEKEKQAQEVADIKVVFPSKFKAKGDQNNKLVSQIEAQSFPIIRDKTNFRVLGVVMVSPYVYDQAQIAIPLEPLSKLKDEDQIKKVKTIAAREIGHVLGLWGFSPNPDDIMFEGEIKEPKLSDRDMKTIKKLYELDPEKEKVLTNL